MKSSDNINPCISVIMSIYNEPSDWLLLSIDSILNQTYKDFEFIIINDNPKRLDNDKIIEEYLSKDERIKIIKNDTNIGLTKSLNKGLKAARGKYIARMDADDIALPYRFEKQIDFLESNSGCIVLGSNVIFIGKKGKSKLPLSNTDIKQFMLIDNPMYHPTVIFRNSIIKENGLYYDESCKFSQDYNFWCRLIQYGEFKNLSTPLLKYRFSNSQITKTKRDEQIEIANTIRSGYLSHYLTELSIDRNGLTQQNIIRTIRQYQIPHKLRALLVKSYCLSSGISPYNYIKVCLKALDIYSLFDLHGINLLLNNKKSAKP